MIGILNHLTSGMHGQSCRCHAKEAQYEHAVQVTHINPLLLFDFKQFNLENQC